MEGKTILEVCPLCGSEMEKGFYIVASQTCWDVKKHKLFGWRGEEISPPFRMACTNFPASRCRKCKLIIFRYEKQNKKGDRK